MIIEEILAKNFPLLTSVSEAQIAALVACSDEIKIPAGEFILGAGQEVDRIFLVIEGSVASLFKRDWGEDRILEEMVAGDLVGEAEYLEGEKCQLDIRALEDSRLLQISKQGLEPLLEQHQTLRQSITESARVKTCRLLVTRYLNNLLGVGRLKISDPMLRLKAEEEWLDFERDILMHLEERSEWFRLKRGKYLFHAGDETDYAYVLASGAVSVRSEDANGKEREINRLGQSEIFGELALISAKQRTASIFAVRDCELFRINPEVIERIAEIYPRIMLSLYKSITERIQNIIKEKESYRPKNPNTAILSTSSDLNLGDFTDKLVAEIALHGSVVRLTSQVVDQSLDKVGIADSSENDPTNLRLARWLNAHESRFDHIVYQSDERWTNWSQRCVRQADHVIVVADATDSPHTPEIQSKLTESWQHWSLVLLHPEDTDRPRNTASWLVGSSAEHVYHVRRGNKGDFARLARILSGRAISLVLSGGGARGAAHLGVLRALEELGIDVDMVGGVSIGARIAGYAAQGMKARECREASRQATKQSLIDLTLPLTSITAGKRLANSIRSDMGTWDIEDFWIPYFCISANLVTGQLLTHRRGNSARAIRASVSLPGLMPPVTGDNELLVDGGVVNDLPVGIMREANPDGLIIGINLSTPKAFADYFDYGESLSGWKQLLNRLNPFNERRNIPSIGEVIMHSMLLGANLSRQNIPQREQADFFYSIRVDGVELFQFTELDRAENIGYEETFIPLREWADSINLQRK